MIVKEYFKNLKGIDVLKQYSDKKVYIERDGVQYDAAIDPIQFADERIYTETDIPIESEEFIDG